MLQFRFMIGWFSKTEHLIGRLDAKVSSCRNTQGNGFSPGSVSVQMSGKSVVWGFVN